MRFSGWLPVALATLCPVGQLAAAIDYDIHEPVLSKSVVLEIADAPRPGGDAVSLSLLAVYSPRLKRQIEARGYSLPDYMLRSYQEVNRFFANTGLATRVRLVGLLEWDLPAGRSLAQDNAALAVWAETQESVRDDFAADLVQLWEVPEAGVDDPAICGWGQTIGPARLISRSGYGYSTVAQGLPGTAFAGCYSRSPPEEFALLLAHELGHNLGSTHGWGEDNGVGAFEFSHGFHCGEAIAGLPQGTLMSTTGYRLPHFSSPLLRRDGEACGNAAGQPYPADNRETFTRTASVVASLRRAAPARSQLSARIPSRIGELTEYLPVELSRSDASEAASVDLLVFGEGARPGADFQAPSVQTVRFSPGQSQLTVRIPLLGDTTPESGESLIIWLQRPQNLVIRGGQGFRVQLLDGLVSLLGGLIASVGSALPLPGSNAVPSEPGGAPPAPPVDEAPPALAAPGGGGSGAAGAGLILLVLLAGRRRPGMAARAGLLSRVACRTAD